MLPCHQLFHQIHLPVPTLSLTLWLREVCKPGEDDRNYGDGDEDGDQDYGDGEGDDVQDDG